MLLTLVEWLLSKLAPPVAEGLFRLNVIPWLALMLPLGGFAVLWLWGDAIKRDREDRGAGLLACLTVILAFDCAVWTGLNMHKAEAEREGERQTLVRSLEQQGADASGLKAIAGPYQPYQPYLLGRPDIDWISVAGLRIPFGLLLDPLTLVMMLVVSGVGSLIHIYSLGYMAHDPERVRYFSYLNLFTFFMLLLVMGGNLPLLFVGWEGVGLCSYLLIGFWFKKKSASDAGNKAFIVNRIGDAGLILGTILAFHTFGTFNLVEITDAVAARPAGLAVITTIALLLFVGACGKSAQIPLHVWLPDAMEGPTPVSALIHAATMVTAGVYMVARLGPLYAKSATAMAVVAGVGAATALVAATIALVQTDIKKVLAYSTVSQLGYMFLACGVGAFGVGIFHLFTHAFFKALLFLGSGSVIHALSGEQDMRKMGGLRRKIPWTFWTFAIGTAAIAGIPPLAGFFSKDEILAGTLAAHKPLLFGLGLLTAALTAFYMARLLFMTFWGSFRGDHEAEHHVHESPWTMLGPLVLLAVGSASVGFLHVPEFVKPVFRLEEPAKVTAAAGVLGHLQSPAAQAAAHGAHAAWLPYVATLTALLGIAFAYLFYVRRRDLPDKIAAASRTAYRVLEEKYGFDLAYNWFASRFVVGGSSLVLWKAVDVAAIDGAVNGTGTMVNAVSRWARLLQTGFVRGYALVMLGGAVALVGYLLWMR
ncbi:MAG TPA: NADH-quinone oxidoreductase subunit L [Vicinamibacteria bacterium]|nr:NADH-quinone oxidoreductase subunit L [Vicinamibacteria bacterium]